MRPLFLMSQAAFAVTMLLTPLAAQTQRVEPHREFIYETAPFPSAHASTLVAVSQGEMLSAWFGGTKEGASDVAIWMARRTSDGWSAPVEMAREPNVPCWNPVLFHARNGRLWLYFKYGEHPASWTAARRHSDDEGKTWSPIEYLPAGIYGPIRTKPYVMPDGTVVSGTSVESYHSWAAWVERSTDGAETWTRSGPITLPELLHATHPDVSNGRAIGLIQPTVIPMGGDHLRLYMRSSIQLRPFLRRRLYRWLKAVFAMGTTRYIGLGIPTIVAAFGPRHSPQDWLLKLLFTAVTTGRRLQRGRGDAAEPCIGSHDWATRWPAMLRPAPVAAGRNGLRGEFSYAALIQGQHAHRLVADGHRTHVRRRGGCATPPYACVFSYLFSGHCGYLRNLRSA